jgi:hemerythrin-like domain-containing protein
MNTRYASQVNRALDEEHRATLALLDQVGRAFAREGAHDAALAAAFGRQVEGELERHFVFEECELFPRLQEAGAGDLAALLLEEHAAIRSVAGELLPLARDAQRLDAAGWSAWRRLALELIERLRSHIDKESAALLPALKNALYEDADLQLALAYLSS